MVTIKVRIGNRTAFNHEKKTNTIQSAINVPKIKKLSNS